VEQGGSAASHTTKEACMAVSPEDLAAAVGVCRFRVGFAAADLAELRRRIQTTRWPEPETVNDDTQGVRLATMQALADYWATDDDLGRVQATLNTLAQYQTEIDGLDLHVLHIPSPHPDALPLIVTHGWPGSIIEQLKLIGPSPTPPPTAATPPTPLIWSSPRSPATGSRPSRPPPAGTRPGPRGLDDPRGPPRL
jgi:hypothetical protein